MKTEMSMLRRRIVDRPFESRLIVLCVVASVCGPVQLATESLLA